MAYPRPIYDARSPHESERTRSAWDPMQRPHYPSMPSPSHHFMPSPGLLDPESENSDVSDTPGPGDDYHSRVHSAYPISIPPPPPKHAVESVEMLDARMKELQRIEDLNFQRQDQLKAKRARKDEKIRRKREAQDLRIKAIMDARARHDDRIGRRRKAEDEAFERVDQELEEEEMALRRRQKRLKRGLPVEDIGTGSRISSVSMSPPGPMYANVPPPPKRHQTGPPGQNDSPVIRPIPHSTPTVPSPAGPNPPPYAFLQSSHPPTSAPYGRSPTISHSPSSNSDAFQPMPRSAPSPYSMNGHPSSPHMSRPPPPPPNSILNTAPPPRQATSYDTRPPPPPVSAPVQAPVPTSTPAPSGFATINTPPTSGFAPINPRNTGSPALANIQVAKAPDSERANGHARTYVSEGTPTGTSASTSSKRTPSTTHPYQMSEAFANRHHHCEKVDHLNRGIWTSYGPGGTKEVPTGPAQEMYLRCNHDGCRRIDWRTVHGLQCHIVKNHDQPKGTIGSLEKALDRYGVSVKEIEAFEETHGEGAGGTMADPKNTKFKAKSRESTEKVDGQRRPYVVQPNPPAYRPNLNSALGNSVPPYQGSPVSIRSLQHEDTEDSEIDGRGTPAHLAAKPPSRPNGFQPVNGGWSTVPGPKPVEQKDAVMNDAPASPHGFITTSMPKRDNNSWKPWSESPASTKPDHVVNAPGSTPMQGSRQSLPTSVPQQPPKDSSPVHSRATSMNFVPTQVIPPTSVPATPVQPLPKQEKTSPQESARNLPGMATIPSQANFQQSIISKSVETTQDALMTGTSEKPGSPIQPKTPIQSREPIEVRDSLKENEKPKLEIVEPSRPEPRSPEAYTRRRGSSRRASLAISRMEKEQEKEKEKEREEAAAAVARAEADAQAEREKAKEQRDKEEGQKRTEPERDKELEKDDDQDEEVSDDPDTITAAVPSTVSKDKDKDKDKEGKESKTTPRRLANGRFVRKR